MESLIEKINKHKLWVEEKHQIIQLDLVIELIRAYEEKFRKDLVSTLADREFDLQLQAGNIPAKKAFVAVENDFHGRHADYELTVYGQKEFDKVKERCKEIIEDVMNKV